MMRVALPARKRRSSPVLFLRFRTRAYRRMQPASGALAPAANPSMPRFVEAAVRGDKEVIAEMLKDDALPVNETDSETMTALHWAAAYNEAGIIRLLLADQRVEVNARNKRKGTPLHQASLSGATEALAVLLADPRVDVNARNRWLETPLMLAAAAGNRASVLALLRAHADATLADQWGSKASEIAAAHGEAVIAQALNMISDGTPPDHHNLASLLSPPHSTQPKPKDTPSVSAGSTTAAPLRSRRILSKMMEAPLNEETALGWISDSDMDICSPDFYKWTPLHKCCAWDKPAFLEALLKHPSLTVTSPAGMDDDTPLHQAAEAGSIRCVTLLVSDCRTHIEARNVHGQTPIMMAARANRVEIIRLLLHKGAKADAAQKDRRTGWHLATECGCEDAARVLWEAMSESAKGMAEEIALLHSTKLKATPKKAAARRGKLSAVDLQNRKVIGPLTAAPKGPLLPPLPVKKTADDNSVP